MPKQIKIDGLTDEQCMFLDIIYDCDSYEELMHFTRGLPKRQQTQIMTLVQMLLHESIEEEVIKPMTSYPDAEALIRKVKDGL